MALKLKKTINFTDHEYWVAEPHMDLKNKRTSILMLLFTNEQSRSSGQAPVLRERFPNDMDKVYPTGKEVYEFVKQSILKQETTEEDGKSVISETETNPFTQAEDVL